MGGSSKAADLSFKVVTAGLGLATIYSITAFSLNYYNGRTKRQIFIQIDGFKQEMEEKRSIYKRRKQAEEQKRQEPSR